MTEYNGGEEIDTPFGIILFCNDCKEWIFVGRKETQTVESPEKVGKFIWKHDGHKLRTYHV